MKMIIKTKHNNRTHAQMHGGTGGRTERGHAKHQQGFVMLWGPLCGRNLLRLLSKKETETIAPHVKNASIHLTDPQGRFFLLNRGLGRNNVGEAGVRVRVLAFQPSGFRGGGQAKTKPRRETISINKVGGQTDGHTDGRREAAPDWVSSQINRGRHGQTDGRTHVRRPRRTGFLHR